MHFGTISVKGQITLPAELRKAYSLDGNVRVMFESGTDGIIIRKAPNLWDFEGSIEKSSPDKEKPAAIKEAVVHPTEVKNG